MRVKHLVGRSALPLLLAMLLVMLVKAPVVRNAVAAGMRLAVGNLVPSLFTFAVVAQLLVRMQMMRPLERLAAPLCRKLRLPEAALSAFLLGAAGGYPLGAQTVVSCFANGRLSSKQAEELLAPANNCGVAYVFSVLVPVFSLSPADALRFYAVHLLSAILSAVFLRAVFGRTDGPEAAEESISPPESFFAAFTASVGSAAASMLTLSGFVCLFSVLTALIRLLPLAFPEWIFGFLELSAGVAALERSDLVPGAFLIGFGGLCVFCQTAAAAAPHKLRLCRYLIGKLLQGLISMILVRLFF